MALARLPAKEHNINDDDHFFCAFLPNIQWPTIQRIPFNRVLCPFNIHKESVKVLTLLSWCQCAAIDLLQCVSTGMSAKKIIYDFLYFWNL